jgi:arylsulfatase A-like enzyme
MRGKKTDTYEGGVHVPGFAVWPGQIAAKQVEEPVHVVDWMPTLARLLEADAPADTDGLDLSPLLFDVHLQERPAVMQPRELYWVWSSAGNRRALRYGDWKIVRYGKQAPQRPEDWQLFHLVDDPKEATDVAAQHPDVLADLHRRFVAQRARDRRPAKKRRGE